MAETKLILQICYLGLGDHLFHSHIPRIAKESGKYDTVYISTQTQYGHEDYRKLIWELNPFVDGFIDEPGITCDIAKCVEKLTANSDINLLDKVMYWYGLDNGKKWNVPEVFYQPKFFDKYAFDIYDPNFVSWVGNVTAEDAMIYFKKQNINFDLVMKIRGEKRLYIPNVDTQFIETPTLFDFCDLIHSSKQLYCLTSGTATLASALGKSATVFWGSEQGTGFQHNKAHQYVHIKRDLLNRVKRKIKKLFQI